MSFLSKADFHNPKSPVRVVPVPELGEGAEARIMAWSVARRLELLDVYSTNISAVQAYQADQERAEDERLGVEKVDLLDQTFLSIIFSLVDEKDEPIYTLDDYDLLKALPYKAVHRLDGAIVAFNSIDVDAKIDSAKKK